MKKYMSQSNKTTDVSPNDLHYTSAPCEYDKEICRAIPFYTDVHEHIARYIKKACVPMRPARVLDLGVGTGTTARVIQKILPHTQFDVVDYSKTMLREARKKLGNKNVRYVLGDYAALPFDKKYDIIVSVIGMHHQTHAGKRKLFKKIFSHLKPGGVFIYGDLFTYQNKHTAAINTARHFHHLVNHAKNKKMLTAWAYHHLFLNNPATLEDQIAWLRAIGFTVKKKFSKMNTALLVCRK